MDKTIRVKVDKECDRKAQLPIENCAGGWIYTVKSSSDVAGSARHPGNGQPRVSPGESD